MSFALRLPLAHRTRCVGKTVRLRSAAFVLSALGWCLLHPALLPLSSSSIGAAAQEGEGPSVLGFERAMLEELPSELAGEVLLSELSCTACHVLPEGRVVAPKRGPVLDRAGERLRPEWLSDFLMSPHATRPGTTMPDLLAGMDDATKRRTVDGLVAFLASDGTLLDTAVTTSAAERGAELFASSGCLLCHRENATDSGAGLALDGLSAKTSIPALSEFLQDPLKHRPAGRMPRFGWSEDEATALASHLLRDIEVPAAVRYRYYEGTWSSLPDFDALDPVGEGVAVSLNPVVGPRRDNFGVVFESFLMIPRDGRYRLRIGSDDGSRLTIDGRVIATVDGVHPVVWADETVELTAGAHPIRVDYFEGGGGEELYLTIDGPGVRRQPIDAWLSLDGQPKAELAEASFGAELIEQGRRDFATLGCAECHQREGFAPSEMPRGGVLVSSRTEGCLTGAAGVPSYRLNDRQVAALRAAIEGSASADTSAARTVDTTMVRFNCVACHRRGELPGPEGRHDSLFTSTQPEMGDEGRLPPPLDGVGAKLRGAWLGELLDQGARDRFYMNVRMPGFGSQNVGHLVDALAAADPFEAPEAIVTDEPDRRLKVVGRSLVGESSLGCVKCHVFGPNRATGIQAISLTTMTRRLKDDWFIAYMLAPSSLRPGTRMPESWPGGATFFPKLLDGKATTQIHAVWKYLSDGDQAPLPAGIGSVGIELTPIAEPIVYRNFIEGAGARAIGVGYPERVNLAFDADQLRLALVWQGSFIDAGLHWTGRGVGFQKPLGENVLPFADASGVAVLADPESAWPDGSARDQGARFRGYRFDATRRPEFLYSIDGRSIVDRFEPIADPRFPGLARTLSFEGTGPALVAVRLIVTDRLTREADGSFVTDQGLKLSVRGPGELSARERDGRGELLWLIDPASTGGSVTIEYRW